MILQQRRGLFLAYSGLLHIDIINKAGKRHPTTTDRIIFTMRIINSHLFFAVTAAQLSSLPFASATMCKHSLDYYGCGKGYYQAGYFTEAAGDNCRCCCEQEDGGGYHRDTCDDGNIKQAAKGCGSCMGNEACKGASNSVIGDDSCVNDQSCWNMKDSFIKQYSCRSDLAAMQRTSVGTHSCGIGKDNNSACNDMWDSTVGDYSCQVWFSCLLGQYVTIENNACNLEWVCHKCEDYSVVPDGACNGDKSDITNAVCNYCRVSTIE